MANKSLYLKLTQLQPYPVDGNYIRLPAVSGLEIEPEILNQIKKTRRVILGLLPMMMMMMVI